MNKTETIYKVEWCKCEIPGDPYYISKPYAPYVPMQGPFCKKCDKLMKKELNLTEFTIKTVENGK